MDSSSFNLSTTFAPRIWSGILNHFSKIEDLHRRLEVVRNLKRKLAYEASIFAAQSEPFPMSRMFLNDTIQFLTKEEEAIVKHIIRDQTPVRRNAEAGTLHGSRYASSSRQNAGPSTGFTLFGVNLFDPERHRATEATLNSNKRKRDSTELGLPPTFVGTPTLPVEVLPRVSNYSFPLGSSANRTSRLFRSPQGVLSTVVTTSQDPVAPTPAPGSLDRGKQPLGQASGSGSVRAPAEPNQRFPAYLLNRNNRNTGC